MSVPKEQCQVCGHFDGKHHPDCNVGDYKRGYRQGVEDAAKVCDQFNEGYSHTARDLAKLIRALLGGGAKPS